MALAATHPALTLEERGVSSVPYVLEKHRGYPAVGSLWSPGYFRADLTPADSVTLIASTESWEVIEALTPEAASRAELDRRRSLLGRASPVGNDPFSAQLVLAADQFIITPAGRADEAARAQAAGEEVRTVIAGYHWFTDWGRDTMISLEGLTISTRRLREAAYILRTFAHYVRDGLIPNMFPDGAREGLYHTADASLWFFHAVHRYVRATDDTPTLRTLLPVLADIVRHHLDGTRFGIGVDPADGLLRQGEAGYQLTWMDAKVDDWVVTPRRGKAVEINALWYNALCLLDGWVREHGGGDGLDLAAHAQRAASRSTRGSGTPRAGISTMSSMANAATIRRAVQIRCSRSRSTIRCSTESRWEAVLNVVQSRLVTPVGLRSLAPGHPDYKAEVLRRPPVAGRCLPSGNRMGLADWPLCGRVAQAAPRGPRGSARALAGFEAHLDQACVGSISEIFDADPPYTPRGCVAQAWSVAEVLRVLEKTQSVSEPAAGL